MNTSRTPGRRCSAIGVTLRAPAARARPTISRTERGSSLIPGISGATSTLVGMPARASSATASSRAAGCGVCGSVARHARSSSVGTDSAALKRPSAASSREQRQVAQQQRRLRQHRARRAVLEQRAPDARHQAVARLDPLVGVGVRAERDVLARPGRPRELARQHLRRVDLDDDLALEVAAGVEVEIAVRRAREAVDAGVRAAPVGVHRPAERHRRALRHAVEHGARAHLVEAHVERLGRVEAPHDRLVAVSREPARLLLGSVRFVQRIRTYVRIRRGRMVEGRQTSHRQRRYVAYAAVSRSTSQRCASLRRAGIRRCAPGRARARLAGIRRGEADARQRAVDAWRGLIRRQHADAGRDARRAVGLARPRREALLAGQRLAGRASISTSASSPGRGEAGEVDDLVVARASAQALRVGPARALDEHLDGAPDEALRALARARAGRARRGARAARPSPRAARCPRCSVAASVPRRGEKMNVNAPS